MEFKKWLLNEVRHMMFEEEPIPLHIGGALMKVTDIDFHFEDFDQSRFGMTPFVQEFPSHVAGEKGQVVVNLGWDGYWCQTLSPAELHLMHSGVVFGNAKTKQLVFDKPELGATQPLTKLQVNPMDKFTNMNPMSIIDKETNSPITLHPPYDKKETLHWWDFAEVFTGKTKVKQQARLRNY